MLILPACCGIHYQITYLPRRNLQQIGFYASCKNCIVLYLFSYLNIQNKFELKNILNNDSAVSRTSTYFQTTTSSSCRLPLVPNLTFIVCAWARISFGTSQMRSPSCTLRPKPFSSTALIRRWYHELNRNCASRLSQVWAPLFPICHIHI